MIPTNLGTFGVINEVVSYGRSKAANHDALRRHLQDLRSQSSEGRASAARAIRLFVEEESRERTGEGFVKVLHSLQTRIEEYGRSRDVFEKLGCILLIDELIENALAGDNERIIISFANQLAIMISDQANQSSTHNLDVLLAATDTLGHLARVAAPGLTYDLLDVELQKALTALGKKDNRHEMNRTASILVVKVLAENAPALFYQNVTKFFACIWPILCDARLSVRKKAAQALHSVLKLLSFRGQKKGHKNYLGLFFSARSVFPEENGDWMSHRAAHKAKGSTSPVRTRRVQGNSLAANSSYSEAQTGVTKAQQMATDELYKENAIATIHGALIVFNELLAPCTGNFMEKHFFDLLNNCIFPSEIRKNKSVIIRVEVMALLPKLAKFCKHNMVGKFLHTWIRYFVEVIKGEEMKSLKIGGKEDRAAAFTALGQLSAVPKTTSTFSLHVNQVIKMVEIGVDVEAKPTGKRLGFCEEALVCLSTVVRTQVFTHELKKEMHSLIPKLFNGGLSEALVSVLTSLGSTDASFLPDIREHLLTAITDVLKPAPVELPKRSFFSKSYANDLNVGELPTVGQVAQKVTFFGGLKTRSKVASSEQTESLQKLALYTLGTFDFSGMLMLPTLMSVVVQFLKSEHVAVRSEAAVACCRLLSSSTELAKRRAELSKRLAAGTLLNTKKSSLKSKQRSYETEMEHVIERLVIMALTDVDPEIRTRVVKELDDRFRELILENPENLRSLFVLVNDQHFAVRASAIRAIGHVTSMAPSYVMPALRTVIVRLLAELEFGSDVKHREESVTLLGLLFQALNRQIAQPFVETLLKALLPKMKDPDPSVTAAMMATVGEIAEVAGDELLPYIGEFLDVIVQTLDGSHGGIRHEAALQALSKLSRNAVITIWPYFHHRRMLDRILVIMTSTSDPWPLRRQAMVTLGTLGALDPHLHTQNMRSLSKGDEGLDALEDGPANIASMLAQVFQVEFLEEDESYAVLDYEAEYKTGGVQAVQAEFQWWGQVPPPGTQEDSQNIDFVYPTMNRPMQLYGETSNGPPQWVRGGSDIGFDQVGGISSGSMKKSRMKSVVKSGGDVNALNTLSRLRKEGKKHHHRRSSVRDMMETAAKDRTKRPSSSDNVYAQHTQQKSAVKPQQDVQRPEKRPSNRAFLFDVDSQVQPTSKGVEESESGMPAAMGMFLNAPCTILPTMVEKPALYFPTVALVALMRVIRDPAGVSHQQSVVYAIIRIFSHIQEEDAASFLPHIVPVLLHIARNALGGTGKVEQRVWPLVELGKLVVIVKGHMRRFLPSIFSLTHEYWNQTPLLRQILDFMQRIASSLESSAMQLYIPNLLSDLLGILHGERENAELKWSNTPAVLATIRSLGDALGDSLYLVLPVLMRLIDRSLTSNSAVPSYIRIQAVQTLTSLIQRCEIADYASRVMHPLVRALYDCNLNSFSESNVMEDNEDSTGVIKTAQASSEFFAEEDTNNVLNSATRLDSQGSLTSNLAGYLARHSPSFRRQGLSHKKKRKAEKGHAAEARRLFRALVQALTSLTFRLEEEFAVYVPMVEAALKNVLPENVIWGIANTIDNEKTKHQLNLSDKSDLDLVEHYRSQVHRILRGLALPRPYWYNRDTEDADLSVDAWLAADVQDKKVEEGQNMANSSSEPGMNLLLPSLGSRILDEGLPAYENLKKAWDATSRSTEEDWVEWMRRLALELLRQSCSSALTNCTSMSQVYEPLSKDLFNAAFFATWVELGLESVSLTVPQHILSEAVTQALVSPYMPVSILQDLLNLAEFMEHNDRPMPLDKRVLGRLALQCNAYTKALRYKEIEFHTTPHTVIDTLITINNNLDQTQAAEGIVEFVKLETSLKPNPSWYAKLGRWQEALSAYEKEAEEFKLDVKGLSDEEIENTLGTMTCLRSLGEWEKLSQLSEDKWNEIMSLRNSVGRSGSRDSDYIEDSLGWELAGQGVTPPPGPRQTSISVEESKSGFAKARPGDDWLVNGVASELISSSKDNSDQDFSYLNATTEDLRAIRPVMLLMRSTSSGYSQEAVPVIGAGYSGRVRLDSVSDSVGKQGRRDSETASQARRRSTAMGIRSARGVSLSSYSDAGSVDMDFDVDR